MVEDYAYVGTEFRDDPDLELLEGSQWGDLGKKEFFIMYFFFHFNYEIFMLYVRD
jgi:hypothetical protein